MLVFFLWTSTFQIAEQKLPSHLTRDLAAGTSATEDLQVEDFERIVVRIVADGPSIAWILNDTRLEGLDQLRNRLSQVAAVRSELPLVIDPEAEIPLSDVLDVYDLGRQLGLSNIQFAVE